MYIRYVYYVQIGKNMIDKMNDNVIRIICLYIMKLVYSNCVKSINCSTSMKLNSNKRGLGPLISNAI